MSKIFPIPEEDEQISNVESGQASSQEQSNESGEEIHSNIVEPRMVIGNVEAMTLSFFALSSIAWIAVLISYPNQFILLAATSSIPMASAYLSRHAIVNLLHVDDEQEFERESSNEQSRVAELVLVNTPFKNHQEVIESLLEAASKNLTKTISAQNSLKLAEEAIGQDFSFYRSSAATFIQNMPFGASCGDMTRIVNYYHGEYDFKTCLNDDQKEDIITFQADKIFLEKTPPELSRGFFIASIAACLKHRERMLKDKYPEDAFAKANSLIKKTIDDFGKNVEVELTNLYQKIMPKQEGDRDERIAILCAYSLMRDGNIKAITSQIGDDIPSTSIIPNHENGANHNLRGAAASNEVSL